MAQLDATTLATATVAQHLSDHNQLHSKANYVFDVMDYGAKGDGTTDDTAAFSAAIAAMTTATHIEGTLYLRPEANFLISTGLTIGDGTKYLNVKIVGDSKWFHGNPPLSGSRITASDGSITILTLDGGSGKANSVVLDGIQLYHPNGASGTCLSMGPDLGFIADGLYCRGGAIGINTTGVIVSPIFRNVTLRAQSAASMKVDSTLTVGLFDSVYFQSSTGLGLSVGGPMTSPSFRACVWQACTDSAIKIVDGGALELPSFLSCWWESNLSHMIELAGARGQTGRSLFRSSFTNCFFDSSAANKDVINISNDTNQNYVWCVSPTFTNCEISIGTGKIFNIGTDPDHSFDPGFIGGTFVGCHGAGDFKGLHTEVTHGNELLRLIECTSLGASNIIANTPFGTIPKYIVERTDEYQINTVKMGFYGKAPVAQQAGVAVSAAAVHAALVTLGLITA